LRRLATAAALLAVTLAGCAGGEEDTERELAPGTLRIGYVGDLRGRDRELLNAARVAVEELHASHGGIDEKLRIELVPRDTSGQPSRAAAGAGALVRDGVRVLVLPCEPAQQAAAAAAARRALSVATCNQNPALWLRFPRAWPVGMGANRQAAALLGYVDDMDFQRLQLVGESRVLDYLAESLGDRAVSETEAADVDAVVLGAAPALVIPEVPVVGTDAMEGGASDGAAYTTYGFPEPGRETDEFYVRYRTLVGRRPARSEAALGYDAIRVISAVVTEAQSTDPRLLVQVFREGFELRGALGPIRYAGDGARNPDVEVAVVTVEEGRPTLLERLDPEEVPPP
jgi:ABC-type branched-subunit amino acid transport system substrate-binding protein